MTNKLRYMVVDDDATNNMICEFTIKRFDKDADIKKFTVSENALTFIKEDYGNSAEPMPTLLFLDINMPTMTGWEFLDIFSEFEDSLKKQFSIYILSSSIQDFSKETANYTSVKGFLSKPLKLSSLETVLNTL